MAPRQWAGRPSAEARVMATLATAGWLTLEQLCARSDTARSTALGYLRGIRRPGRGRYGAPTPPRLEVRRESPVEIRARLGYVPRAINEYKKLYRLRLDDPARLPATRAA